MREGFCQADCGYLVFYEQTGFCHMFRRLHVPDIHNLVTVSRELLEVSLWSLIVPQCPTFNACSHVHTAHSSVCNPVLFLNHLLSNTFITFVTFVWFGPIWGVVNSSCLLAMVLFSWRGSDEKIGPARNWYSAQKLHQSESWKLEVKGTRLEEIKRFKRFYMDNKDSFPVSATNFEQFESFSYRRLQLQQCSRFSGIKPTELLQEFQMKPCGHADLHLSHIWLISIQALLILSIRTDSLRIWFVIYSYLFMRLQLASQPYKFQENSTKKQDKVLAFGRT